MIEIKFTIEEIDYIKAVDAILSLANAEKNIKNLDVPAPLKSLLPHLLHAGVKGIKIVLEKLPPEKVDELLAVLINWQKQPLLKAANKEAHKFGLDLNDIRLTVLSDVEALIAPAKADFLALVPQVKKLTYPDSSQRGYQNYGMHGLGHIYRVLLLSLIYYYNSGDSLTPADKNVLAYFAILHDIGRTNNGKDPSHGKKALKVIRDHKIEIEGLNLTEEDLLITSIVIPGHCNGKGKQQVLDAIPEGPARDRALKLYCVCKDMDALDRVRFKGTGKLDTSQLRTDYAKRMADTAAVIYHEHLARHLAES